MSREDIFKEISYERDYQNTEYGTDTDDRYEIADNYPKILFEELDMAQVAGFIAEYAEGVTKRTWMKPARERMIKVAALAVATVEKLDRRK